MKDCLLRAWRVVAFAMVFCLVVAIGRGGEPIIFSKSDRNLAIPNVPTDARLPENENRSVLFVPQPASPTIPYIAPPPVNVPPRKAERRTLFDEPELFSDKSR